MTVPKWRVMSSSPRVVKECEFFDDFARGRSEDRWSSLDGLKELDRPYPPRRQQVLCGGQEVFRQAAIGLQDFLGNLLVIIVGKGRQRGGGSALSGEWQPS